MTETIFDVAVGPDGPFGRPPRYPASLNELVAFASELTDRGYDLGPRVAQASAIAAAIETAVPELPSIYLADNLLDLDPAEVTRRVRAACVSILATRGLSPASQVATEFSDRLAAALAVAFREASDSVVIAMRPGFTHALAVIHQAAIVGLEPSSTAASVVDSRDPKQLKSWHNLPAAVATLDGFASIRDRLTDLCDVGPYRYPAAAWITDADLLAIEGAAGLIAGKTYIKHTHDGWDVRDTRTAVPRTGGRWLALVAAGYELAINTGSEADAVVQRARETAA